MKKQNRGYLIFFMVLIFMVSGIGSLQAKDMGGWGIDDPYNQHYIAADVEKMKVYILEIKEVVPLPGMSPGVALVVREGDDGDEMLVHLCPVSYKKAGRIGLKKGEKITLRGVFAEINGEEVVMAAKIKTNDKVFKVRLTSDGTPFWTMPPAQLQKELSSAE